MMPASHNIDAFVQEKIILNKTINSNFIAKQINQDNNERFLVAEITELDKKKIAGYCRLEKKDPQTMYIHFILVDRNCLRLGIAKQLAHAAMNSFDGVTQCNFRALVHYDFINDLYSKYGCVKKGTISLNIFTGKISTDPNAPITHIDYTHTIKK